MTTLAPAGPTRALPTSTMALAWFFAAACAAMAILIPVFDHADWELTGSIVEVAAALLVATGLLVFGRTSPWLAVGLVTLGALTGGVFLVWTLVAPILALVLIVRFGRGALRGASVITG